MKSIIEKLGITPGPWGYDDYGGSVYGKSIGGVAKKEDIFKICDIRGWGHLQYLGEDAALNIQKANQKVISAAPEMLVRDINFLKQLDEFMEGCKEAHDTGAWHTANMIKSWFDWEPDQKATGKSWPEIKELIK